MGDEVGAGGDLPGAADLEAAVAAGWVRVMDVGTDGPDFPKLAAGEASILRLAMAHTGGKLVVIDEQLGRARAKALGIPITGVVGVLLASKREGHIEEISTFLQRLQRYGFRLSTALIETALAQAHEPPNR